MNPMLAVGLPAVVAGACSVSFLYFGIYILPTAAKDRRFRPLAYLCFFSSVWCFCFVMFYLGADRHSADFWQRYIYAGMLAFAFLLRFFIRYTGFIRSKIASAVVNTVIWIPPMIAAYRSISGNAVAADFPLGFWFLFVQIKTTIYNIASIVLLTIYSFKQKTYKNRKQAYILCVSGIILVSLSWIADYYLGYYDIQNLIPFWLLIWIGILLYTIKKYRFITITPDFISRDITENIDEGIVLLNPDLTVIFMNDAMRRMLNVGENYPSHVQDFVSEKHVLVDELSGLAKTESISFRIRVSILSGASDARIPVDMKVKKVIDTFRDTSGYLIIVSRVKELKLFTSMYRITDREIDIIRQLAVGGTNRKIADIYRLSERTVETHITNIYGKLGVANRIELLNVLAGFDVGDTTGRAPVSES